MLNGTKEVERKEEGEYEVVKFHKIKADISSELFDNIVNFFGEETGWDGTSGCFFDLNENTYIDVDDIIQYFEENILGFSEDFDKETLEDVKKWIKILSKYKGYLLS